MYRVYAHKAKGWEGVDRFPDLSVAQQCAGLCSPTFAVVLLVDGGRVYLAYSVRPLDVDDLRSVIDLIYRVATDVMALKAGGGR